jgi:hypothetical protein
MVRTKHGILQKNNISHNSAQHSSQHCQNECFEYDLNRLWENGVYGALLLDVFKVAYRQGAREDNDESP